MISVVLSEIISLLNLDPSLLFPSIRLSGGKTVMVGMLSIYLNNLEMIILFSCR